MSDETGDSEERERADKIVRRVVKMFIESRLQESLLEHYRTCEGMETYSIVEDFDLINLRQKEGALLSEHHKNFSEASKEYTSTLLKHYRNVVKCQYLGGLYRQMLGSEPTEDGLEDGLEKALEKIDRQEKVLSKSLEELMQKAIGGWALPD